MTRLIPILLFILSAVPALAQETPAAEERKVYTQVETNPEFPGGIQAFYRFVMKNYKTPSAARSVSGRMIVTFVVEADGTLSGFRIVKDLGYGTGEEAVRMLKTSPKWEPGTQDGKPVAVQYALPINLTPAR